MGRRGRAGEGRRYGGGERGRGEGGGGKAMKIRIVNPLSLPHLFLPFPPISPPMCTRGVWQLEKLIVRYCAYGGSSASMRALISQSEFTPFITTNPQLSVVIERRNGHHPTLQGHYKHGATKTVCVKNESPATIRSVMEFLRNQNGHRSKRHNVHGVVAGVAPSVQGSWSTLRLRRSLPL